MNEIEILKKNVRDLQEQLRNAYVRIKQLNEELKSFLNHEEVSFKPDIKLVEETKPTAKIIPLVGAISGDKDE